MSKSDRVMVLDSDDNTHPAHSKTYRQTQAYGKYWTTTWTWLALQNRASDHCNQGKKQSLLQRHPRVTFAETRLRRNGGRLQVMTLWTTRREMSCLKSTKSKTDLPPKPSSPAKPTSGPFPRQQSALKRSLFQIWPSPKLTPYPNLHPLQNSPSAPSKPFKHALSLSR